MRNAVAKWVLSRVVAEDRAEAVLGDLLEARPVGFWSLLLGTAVSIALHRPYRLLAQMWSASVWMGIEVACVWAYMHYIGWSLRFALMFSVGQEASTWWVLRRRRQREAENLHVV